MKRTVVTAVTLGAMAASMAVAAPKVNSKAKKAYENAKKPQSISLMVDGTFLVKENGEQILVDGFKSIYGVEMKLNHPIHNQYKEKVNLAFTTGDIPDVLLLDSTNYNRFAVNGALADITDYFELSSIKKNYSDLGLVEALKVNGKLYGLPEQRGNGPITYVRGDWLDKLGLKAPTNWDEYLNMLRQFKNNNPDGLKPEEVIPLTAAGLISGEYPYNNYMPEFYQDARPDLIKKNGKWVDGMLQPEMKKALERLRTAYAEGLIDKEVITNKTSSCRNKFFAGNVGVFTYWAGTWNWNLQKNLTPNVPQGEVRPILPIKGVKYIERPAPAVSITSKCANPAGVFKYVLEKMYDCGEGQKLFTYGVEGKTYEMVGGKISFLPSIENPKNKFTKTWFEPGLDATNYKPARVVEPVIEKSLAMFQSNCVCYTLPPTSDEMAELGPELDKIRSSYITKIVYGDLSIDAGLDAYAKEAKKYTDAIIKSLK